MDEVLDGLVTMLVPAIGGLLVAILACATAWLRMKTRSLEAKEVIDLAAAVVADVQVEVQHTVVDYLKRHHRWDDEAAGKVKAAALAAVKRNLGPMNMLRLNEALSGAADGWLETRLEATVARSKREHDEHA